MPLTALQTLLYSYAKDGKDEGFKKSFVVALLESTNLIDDSSWTIPTEVGPIADLLEKATYTIFEELFSSDQASYSKLAKHIIKIHVHYIIDPMPLLFLLSRSTSYELNTTEGSFITLLNFILSKKNIEEIACLRNKNGDDILTHAIKQGNCAAVTALVKSGMNVNDLADNKPAIFTLIESICSKKQLSSPIYNELIAAKSFDFTVCYKNSSLIAKLLSVFSESFFIKNILESALMSIPDNQIEPLLKDFLFNAPMKEDEHIVETVMIAILADNPWKTGSPIYLIKKIIPHFPFEKACFSEMFIKKIAQCSDYHFQTLLAVVNAIPSKTPNKNLFFQRACTVLLRENDNFIPKLEKLLDYDFDLTNLVINNNSPLFNFIYPLDFSMVFSLLNHGALVHCQTTKDLDKSPLYLFLNTAPVNDFIKLFPFFIQKHFNINYFDKVAPPVIFYLMHCLLYDLQSIDKDNFKKYKFNPRVILSRQKETYRNFILSLLKNPKLSIDLIYEEQTILHLAIKEAATNHDHRILNAIFARNPQLDPLGITPASFKALEIYPQFLPVLIEAGCNVNAEDANRRTLLYVAVRDKKEFIYECLMKKNADCLPRLAIGGYTLLHAAIHGRFEKAVVELLKRKQDVNAVTSCDHKLTPLSIAMSKGFYEFVPTLIEHGADPNVSYDNLSMLMLAIKAKQYLLARLFITAHADVNFKYHNATPLSLAIMLADYELVELLLINGAELDLTKPEGLALREHTISHNFFVTYGQSIQYNICDLIDNNLQVKQLKKLVYELDNRYSYLKTFFFHKIAQENPLAFIRVYKQIFRGQDIRPNNVSTWDLLLREFRTILGLFYEKKLSVSQPQFAHLLYEFLYELVELKQAEQSPFVLALVDIIQGLIISSQEDIEHFTFLFQVNSDIKLTLELLKTTAVREKVLHLSQAMSTQQERTDYFTAKNNDFIAGLFSYFPASKQDLPNQYYLIKAKIHFMSYAFTHLDWINSFTQKKHFNKVTCNLTSQQILELKKTMCVFFIDELAVTIMPWMLLELLSKEFENLKIKAAAFIKTISNDKQEQTQLQAVVAQVIDSLKLFATQRTKTPYSGFFKTDPPITLDELNEIQAKAFKTDLNEDGYIELLKQNAPN